MANEDIIPIDHVHNRAIGPAHPAYVAWASEQAIPEGARWRTGLFSANDIRGGMVLYGHALVTGTTA